MPTRDAIDRKILAHLQSDGRITRQELADKVGLSVSPCHRRVKLMEDRGVITRYIATVDQKSVGLHVSVFISIKLARQKEEDLNRFGCNSADEFRRTAASGKFIELAQFESARAWQFYSEGWPLMDWIEDDSRAALWALARIYSGILEKIEARGFDVLAQPPAHLSAAEKVWILARARLGWRDPNYVVRMRERDRRRAGGAVRGRRAESCCAWARARHR